MNMEKLEEIISKQFCKMKDQITEYVAGYKERTDQVTDLQKMYLAQLGLSENVLKSECHFNGIDGIFLNAYIRLYYDMNMEAHEMLASILKFVPTPYAVYVDGLFMCATRETDLYLVNPSRETSCNRITEIQFLEDEKAMLSELGTTQMFIESLIESHEDGVTRILNMKDLQCMEIYIYK
jgi:hypothetical protein